MSTTQIIIYVVSAVCSVAGIIIGFVFKLKNGSIKKSVDGTIDIAATINRLGELMIEAERIPNYTGAEKLNYVMTNFELESLNAGKKFDIRMLQHIVDQLINFSKKVNNKPIVINPAPKGE